MECLFSFYKDIMEELISEILTAFSALWRVRKIGNSYEIITPVATSNNMFVSVFLTRRGGEYVVTDAGWIDSGAYDIDEISDAVYKKIISYYMYSYGIRTVKAHNLVYYFKKTDMAFLVPNLVFDVSAFISGLVSTSCAEIAQTTDKSYNIFNKKAHAYLRTFIPNDSFLSKKEVKETFPALTFGAAVKCQSGISLLNFATGSNANYYINSLCKSQTSFEIVKNSDVGNKFQNRILLLDDSKKSLNTDKVGVYVDFIRNKRICDIDTWSQRMVLKDRLVV